MQWVFKKHLTFICRSLSGNCSDTANISIIIVINADDICSSTTTTTETK
jgi:hypothetical protein